MKYALVLGHDKIRQGAVGSEGITEYQFNSDLIYEILDQPEVAFSPNQFKRFDRNPNIKGYTAQMKDLHERIDEWGADVSVSFHFNDASDKSVNGYEILYYSIGGGEFAKKLDAQFDELLETNDRGIKQVGRKMRGGGFLSRGKSKCILVEAFFASNQRIYISGGSARKNLIKAFVNFFK